MNLSHETAIQYLEEELQLAKDILVYFDTSKNKLAAQNYTMMDASYRHWAINRIRIKKRLINLEYTINFLKQQKE